jgi:hypothetical protein
MSKISWIVLPLVVALCVSRAAATEVVLIGHPGVPRLDVATIQKLYKGRIIEVGGISVTAANAAAGNALRRQFLEKFLGENEDAYTAYWTVRRFIGKGTPPPELPSSGAIIHFVQNTAGAIGYVEATEIRPGLNILHRR